MLSIACVAHRRSHACGSVDLLAVALLAAMAASGAAEPVGVAVELGPPVDVAVAPPELRDWGPYQFPGLCRLADGSIQLSFHVEADSATAYGRPPARAISKDDGATWTLLPRETATDGTRPAYSTCELLLPSGERLATKQLPALKAADVKLPPQAAAEDISYANPYRVYRIADLPREAAGGWKLMRQRAGGGAWVEEQAVVRLPGEVRAVTEGVLPLPWFDQFFLAPDGAIWSVNYMRRLVDERLQRISAVFLRSTDEGRTWDFWSEIPYEPVAGADPHGDEREGFTEPSICFLADGSVLCLLRTTDGRGVGPLYASRSTDNGRTWSRPAVFDDLGVWPQMLRLGNGVTLAAYGRPGLIVRAAADPQARQWSAPATVVPRGDLGTDTCSYTALLALDESTALLAYSEFALPGPDGRPCKRMRVRKVSARPDAGRPVTELPRAVPQDR